LGHRHIACIAGPAGIASSTQRVAGWSSALRDAGLKLPKLLRGDFTSRGGYRAMGELLQQPRRPSAVFVCNDLMAIGALCAVHEHGLRVPDDMSVIGFDDIELALFTSPPLTTVAQ